MSPGGQAERPHPERPHPALGPVAALLSQMLIWLVRGYQLLISPLLGPSCRFQPTCSRYAIVCLSTHGPMRGSWLAVRRIACCHPFHPGGYDPPPPRASAPSSDPPFPSRDD